MAAKRVKEPWWSLAAPPARTATRADAWYELALVTRTQWRSFRGALKANPEAAWGVGLAMVMGGPVLIFIWAMLFISGRLMAAEQPPGAEAGMVSVSIFGILLTAAVLHLSQAGTTLTHSATMPVLFTMPLRSRSVLFGVVLQQAVLSLWAPLLAMAPALGVLSARGALLAGGLPVVLTTLASSLVLTCAGVFLGATVVRVVPGGRWQEWSLLLSSGVGMLAWFLTQTINMNLHVPGRLAQLGALSRWLPVWSPLGWTGGITGLAGQGFTGLAWLAGAGALLGAALLGWGLISVLDRMYRDGLAAAPVGTGGVAGAAKRQLVARTGWAAHPVTAMARREWRRLVRSPRLFGLPLALTAPMVVPMLMMPGDAETPILRGVVPFALAMGAVITAMSAVGSEEKAFWLTRLTPMLSREIVYGKAISLWALFAGAGGAVALAAGWFAGMPAWQVALMLVHTGLAVAAAVAIGLMGGCTDPLFTPVQKNQYVGMGASATSAFGMLGWLAVNAGAYVTLAFTLRSWLPGPWLEVLLTAAALLLNGAIISGLLTGAGHALARVEVK